MNFNIRKSHSIGSWQVIPMDLIKCKIDGIFKESFRHSSFSILRTSQGECIGFFILIAFQKLGERVTLVIAYNDN